jgi:hypothetical protein
VEETITAKSFPAEIEGSLNKVSEAIKQRDQEQTAKIMELTETVESITKEFQEGIEAVKKLAEESFNKKVEQPKPETSAATATAKLESEDLSEEETTKGIELLNRLIRVMRGQEDPRTHVTVITNPNLEHLISSSNLGSKQAQAIINMKWIANQREEFKPLGELADVILKAAISSDGWGTDKGIALAEAYAPRLVSSGNQQLQSEPKRDRFSLRKKPQGEKE